MTVTAGQRAAAPFLQALAHCTDHLDALEVFEVCTRGGEAELNDLLRHAANRIVRPAQIVQREQSRGGLISRADLALTDTGSGMLWAVIESKMVYSTDAVDAQGMWGPKFARDVAKLAQIPDPNLPGFLLTWMPHFATLRRPLRYMRGHVADGDGYAARRTLDEARAAIEGWLDSHGARAPRVTVREAETVDGQFTLDAYLTLISRRSPRPGVGDA